MIIASAPDQVEQIRRAPDDILSTRDASREVVFFSSRNHNDIWPNSDFWCGPASQS